MADENKDIAVLGFQIQSKDAVEAINGIISALDGVSKKAESVDQALEDKVTKALKAMSSAATALGKEETIAGLERTVTALKGLSDASTAFSSFIDNSADIKKGVALLNKVNLGSILEGYSSAIKNTGNEFSKLNPILKDAVKGFSDALSIPDTDKRAQAMGKVSESLRGLYQTLNEYTGEKPAKILPKGILEGDVKDTALKVDTLRGYLDEYVSVLTRVNEVSGKSRHDMQQYNPDEWAKQNQADLAKAKDNAIAVMTDIAKTWQNLNPSFSTIRFNIEIANMDVIKRQLHSGIEVKLAVPPAEVDRFNNVATTMEKLAKPVAVTYDTKQANDIKQLLSDITPKFTITESAINSLQRQMDDASQRLAMEVKIVPRVTGDDEAIAQMQKQAAERARDALTAMGIDVHGKKSIEDAIKGDYYGLVNIGKDLEQLYGGDKVNGILGDLFPKQGATSEQMFKSFTESLGEVRRNMEGLLAFKATLDTSEFDAALDKFKDTLTSVFTPESKQKFTNALVEDLKKTVLKPASITVSPQKIFVDRSDAIMEFVQKTLAMPVDAIVVTPTTIWVDKSASEIRLLQVQFVADWQDVIVHPENILLDIASVPPERITALGDSANAISITVKSIVAHPLSAKVNLSSIPKEALTVTGREISVRPSSIRLDIPDAVQNNAILRIEKTLKVVADMVVFPNSIKFDNDWKGFDKVIRVLPKPVALLADTVVRAKSVSVDDEALQNRLPIKYNQSILPVNARIRIFPTAAIVDRNAAQQIVGTSSSAIRVNAKINIDPLPSDEIQKMQDLTKAIGRVNAGYLHLNQTAQTLEGLLKSVNGQMNGAMQTLLSKQGAKALKQASTNAANQQAQQQMATQVANAMYQMLHGPVNNSWIWPARTRDETAISKHIFNMRQQGGVVANLQNEVADEYDKATNTIKADVAAMDMALQTEITTLQSNASAIRQNADQTRQFSMSQAQARAQVIGLNPQLRQMNLIFHDLEPVADLNLADPFVKLKAAIGDSGSRLADMFRTFGIYLSARSMVNYFKQASEAANTFGMELRRIQSLALDFDFGKLRSGLMDIDARFGSVVHNARALYMAYTSGVRGTEKDLVGFTETMSKLATTIQSDVMPTIDSVTSVMNAWNLSANSANEIADLIFSTIKYGKSNAAQLTTSLGHVVAPAAALNLQLDELGASIAVLTKTMKTNRAMTYLSNILGKMASPTKAVQEAAAELGIELSANSIKARGFAQTLKDIRLATGGDIAKIAKIFPDLRGQRAALTLLGTQYKDFEAQLGNMRNKAGSMEEALAKIADTPEAQIKALKNTMSMLALEVGNTTNNMLTLGGALGPVLQWFNGLNNQGRTIAGNLVAASAATAGLLMASKAFMAAQYAMLQTSYQQAAAANELRRNELDMALLKERQAVQTNQIAVAETKAQIAARLYNNEEVRNLKMRKEALDDAIRLGQQDAENARQALKINDVYVKQVYEAKAADIGKSNYRLTMLKGLRVDNMTDQAMHDVQRDRDILTRMQAIFAADRKLLQGETENFVAAALEEIRSYVESNTKLKKDLDYALSTADLKATERAEKLLGTIVSKVKQTEVISSAMQKYAYGDDLIQMAAKDYVVTELNAKLTKDQAYNHEIIIRYLDEEIAKQQTKVDRLRDSLKIEMDANNTSAEHRAQVDAQIEAEERLAALTQTRNDVVADLNKKTNDLVQREKDYLAVLDNNVKEGKSFLDQNTMIVEKLKQQVDLQLRNAAFIGKDTLSAVQATTEAQLSYRSALVNAHAVQDEIRKLTDATGKLIEDTVPNQVKLNELEAQKVEYLRQAVAERKRFITLGVLSGNVEARNMREAELKAQGASLDAIVDAMARNKGVVSEAIKSMSNEIGKNIFGGILNGKMMRLAPWALSGVPGMNKLAMPLSIMSSFNIIGKTTSGIARLSGTLVNLSGVTERLQKRGVMSLTKGTEDLAKALLKSKLTMHGFKLSLESLKEIGVSGGVKSLALSGAMSANITAAIGLAIAGALYLGVKYAFDQTDKGGPFGELMEKAFNVEGLKKHGEYLNAQRELMLSDKENNDNMIREMKRMIAASQNIQEDLVVLAERNRMIEALAGLEQYQPSKGLEFRTENVKSRIEDLQTERDKLFRSMFEMDPRAQRAVQEEINKLDQQLVVERQKLKTYTEIERQRYNDYLKSIGEARYQSLREMLESDRDTAFMPKKDAAGRFATLQKMTNMAMTRMGSIISPEKNGIVDLSIQTTDQVRELIHDMVSELAANAKRAQKAYEDAAAALNENDKDYEEKKKEVERLRGVAETAQKNLESKEQDIRSGYNDLYSKLIERASASVDMVLEQVKRRDDNAKYFSQFDNMDLSFRANQESIMAIRKEIDKQRNEYAKMAGNFKQFDDDGRQTVFLDNMKKLTEEARKRITANINTIKSVASNLATFMETLSSDAQAAEKSLFDARMSNPAYSGIRNKLIGKRFGMIGQILYGANGQSGLVAMRNQALEEAKRLQGLNDPQGAMKYLTEAQKRQKQIAGYEQQQLDLVKLKADKEREINQSLYQLANTLRGQFAATSQAAIDVNSVEGIRLRSRRLGENIAPPTAFTAQQAEQKFREEIIRRDAKFSQDLAKFSQDFFAQLSAQMQNTDINGAAATMGTAATTFNTAATTFSRTMQGMNNMVIAVKRI